VAERREHCGRISDARSTFPTVGVNVTQCPEDDCEATVAICDNGVRLDFPAEPFSRDPLGAQWTIMQLGPMAFATAGGEDPPNGLGHRLHEHQPPES
jgi:hypothetical protein